MNQKGGRTSTLERWADRVEDALKPHAGGLKHAQVAELAGMSLSTTSKALCASAKRGGVLFIRRANDTLWWHHEHRALVHARQAELKAAAKARAHQARGRTEEIDAALAAFERPIVQRVIPASQAAILRPKGPNSVWGLAA